MIRVDVQSMDEGTKTVTELQRMLGPPPVKPNDTQISNIDVIMYLPRKALSVETQHIHTRMLID